MTSSKRVSLPESWVLAELGELLTAQYGRALPEAQRNDQGSFPVIGSSGIVGKHDQFCVDQSCVVIGRKGSAGSVHLLKVPSWPIDTAYYVTPPPEIDLHYLYYLLGSLQLVQLDKSTAIPSLSRDDLYRVQIPIAPSNEQTRIVEKLEELLSDLDAGVAELKAAQKKLALYRQSLLKAVVEGALTADWRARRAARGEPQETGADLLARILTERRTRWEARQLARFKEQGKTPPKGWQAKYPEPVRPDTEKLPMLPEGWAWASVAQLGEVTTGSTPSTTDAENFGDAIPFFKPGDLDAGYYVEQSRERLSEAGAAMGRVLPEKSVLVTCIGATIGKTGFARVSCATNQQINALSVSEGGVIPEFVYWLMVSGAGQRQIIENASATTLPILNKSKFEKLVLPIAPLPEQTEIVSVLETESERISTQETAIKHALRQATAQRKNLLKAAFSGQLVPQDPNDEPASALLARIRAEREARSNSSPNRRTRKAAHA